MSEETKKCPYCGADVPLEAKKCRYCGEWLVTQEKDKPKASFHCSAIIEGIIAIIIVIMMFTTSYSDSLILFVIIAYIVLNLYFLPTLIADKKRTQYTGAILALNLLLGLTVIVWVGCLIWAIVLPDLSKNTTENKDNKNSNYLNVIVDDFRNNFKPSQKVKEVPTEIQGRFNWGAFLLNWIWGIGNKSYQTLWCLIPFAGIIWAFVCGLKGNEWAWQNKKWTNVEEFNRVQRKWTIGSSIVISTFLILSAVLLIVAMNASPQKTVNISNKTQIEQIKDETNKIQNAEPEYYIGDDEIVVKTYTYQGIDIEYDSNSTSVSKIAPVAKQCYNEGNTDSESLNQCVGIKLHWF